MIAQILADKMNNTGHVDAGDVAEMLAAAALETLEFAAAGNEIFDDLTREQAGIVMAAVGWNYQPLMRMAVRSKPNGQKAPQKKRR